MNLNAMMIASLISTLVCCTNRASASFYPQGDDCRKNRSLYYHYLKLESYPDARNFWLKAYAACGGKDNMDATFFYNGTLIYKGLLEKNLTKDSQGREAIQDSLIWVYDQYLEFDSSAQVKLNYARKLIEFGDTNYTKISQLFEAVHDRKEKLKPAEMNDYFKHLLLNRYNNAEEALRPALTTEIVGEYFMLMHYSDLAIEKARAISDYEARTYKLRIYRSIKKVITGYIKQIITSCDGLEDHFSDGYDLLPADTSKRYEKLTENLNLMEEFNCTQTAIYRKSVNASLAIRPVAAGYLTLAKLERNTGNYKEAVVNFERALDLTTEDSLKAEVHYELALFYYNQKSYRKAFKMAQNVSGEREGKAKLIMGNSIAKTANSCGESTFAREANFWLANDYYLRALKLGETVNPEQFLDRAPTQRACFEIGLTAGDTYEIACWNKKTVVRY